MAYVTASKARRDFADILSRVAFGKERIVVHRHGKKLVAVIPIEDLELLGAIENRLDVEDARVVLAEMEGTGEVFTTLEQLKTDG